MAIVMAELLFPQGRSFADWRGMVLTSIDDRSKQERKNSALGQKSGGIESLSDRSSQLRHSCSWQQEMQLVCASYQAAPWSTRATTAGLTPTQPIMRSTNSARRKTRLNIGQL